jgi:hypothetical protein
MMLSLWRSGACTSVMRIKIVRTPTQSSVDGIRVDGFHRGSSYDVGTTLASLFLAEGWAVPAEPDEAALPMGMAELESEEIEPPNLIRDSFPPDYEGRFISEAADRPSRGARRREDGDKKRKIKR